MGKKYTLKAVRPDTPPQEAVEIQPVVDAPQPKTETSSSDFLGFLKFLLIIACVGGLVYGLGYLITKAKNDRILDELMTQAVGTGMSESVTYLKDIDTYGVIFKLDAAQSTIIDAYNTTQEGMLQWGGTVSAVIGWNKTALDFIRKSGSKAHCIVVLRDKYNTMLLMIDDGELLTDTVRKINK